MRGSLGNVGANRPSLSHFLLSLTLLPAGVMGCSRLGHFLARVGVSRELRSEEPRPGSCWPGRGSCRLRDASGGDDQGFLMTSSIQAFMRSEKFMLNVPCWKFFMLSGSVAKAWKRWSEFEITAQEPLPGRDLLTMSAISL